MSKTLTEEYVVGHAITLLNKMVIVETSDGAGS